MKNTIFFRYIAAALIMVCYAAVSSCSDDNDDTAASGYLNLSVGQYTFEADGSDKLTVTVDAADAWTYRIEGDWAYQDSATGDVLVVGAAVNNSGNNREGKLIFTSGDITKDVYLFQLVNNESPDEGDFVFKRFPMSDYKSVVMSPDGKYVAAIKSWIDPITDAYEYMPVLVETATGKETEYAAMNYDLTLKFVCNDGRMIINGNEIIDPADGTITRIASPAGGTETSVGSASADGAVMVGYSNIDGLYRPVKWTDGVARVIPMMETSLSGAPLTSGVMARGCSSDGSIIYGSEWDKQALMYWDGDEPKYVGEELIIVQGSTLLQYPGTDSNNNYMSPNGKYLGSWFYVYTGTEMKKHPFWYDIETGTTEIIYDLSDSAVSAITNDGLLICRIPQTGVQSSVVYDTNTGESMTAYDWIKDHTGAIPPAGAIIFQISEDKKTILGGTVSIPGGSTYHHWYVNIP